MLALAWLMRREGLGAYKLSSLQRKACGAEPREYHILEPPNLIWLKLIGRTPRKYYPLTYIYFCPSPFHWSNLLLSCDPENVYEKENAFVRICNCISRPAYYSSVECNRGTVRKGTRWAIYLEPSLTTLWMPLSCSIEVTSVFKWRFIRLGFVWFVQYFYLKCERTHFLCLHNTESNELNMCCVAWTVACLL